MRAAAFVLVVGAGLGLAGCASGPARPAAKAAGQSANATPIPPPVATGASVDCVNLQNIRETRVIDDNTIDFILRDGKVLRNTLPQGCPQLGFERAFSYQTSISQLCSVDIITVIQQGGGLRRGASCGLGKFTPITPVRK